jgi:hypothetical protein
MVFHIRKKSMLIIVLISERRNKTLSDKLKLNFATAQKKQRFITAKYSQASILVSQESPNQEPTFIRTMAEYHAMQPAAPHAAPAPMWHQYPAYQQHYNAPAAPAAPGAYEYMRYRFDQPNNYRAHGHTGKLMTFAEAKWTLFGHSKALN